MEQHGIAADQGTRGSGDADGTEGGEPLTVEIYLEGDGIEAGEVIAVHRGSRVQAVVALFASKCGYDSAHALLFVEDELEPLALDLVIDEWYPHHHRKHHIHRCRQIEVVVHYAKLSHERRFPPSARVETVLAWALTVFPVDAAMAGEFELTLVGSSDELPGSKHIGTLIKHPTCRLELNLGRGVLPNGAPT